MAFITDNVRLVRLPGTIAISINAIVCNASTSRSTAAALIAGAELAPEIASSERSLARLSSSVIPQTKAGASAISI